MALRMAKSIDKTTLKWAKIKPKSFADEQEFVKALKRDEQRAWTEFQELYDRQIHYFAWRSLGLPDHALDDQVQEIYAKFPRAIQNYQQKCPLYDFVRKVTIDLCIDTIRKKDKRKQVFCSTTMVTENGVTYEHEGFAPQSTYVHECVALNEKKRAVREVLATLSERCQEVIKLRYFKQQEYKRIAEELTLSTNTVGSRLRKCMVKMASGLAAYQ
jgi:RNA polymerase sigma factor (sigma-70 family)